MRKHCFVGLLVTVFIAYGTSLSFADSTEYDLYLETSEGQTFDLSFLIDTDLDGVRKDQNGNVYSTSIDNSHVDFFYTTLTRDGVENYADENWSITPYSDDVDYFLGYYTQSVERLTVNSNQNFGTTSGDNSYRDGYSIQFLGVTLFDDVWYEDITSIQILSGADWDKGWQEVSTYTINLASESAPVPEPATIILFGAGLAGLAGWRVRRKK